MQLKSTQFFESHNFTVTYALAAWLAEEYTDWEEMRDELKQMMEGK